MRVPSSSVIILVSWNASRRHSLHRARLCSTQGATQLPFMTVVELAGLEFKSHQDDSSANCMGQSQNRDKCQSQQQAKNWLDKPLTYCAHQDGLQ